MNVLLDTHALIGSLEGGDRLSAAAREIIEDAATTVVVSVVSAWEVAIKSALGRLEVPDDLLEAIEDAGFVSRGPSFADVDRHGHDGGPSPRRDRRGGPLRS